MQFRATDTREGGRPALPEIILTKTPFRPCDYYSAYIQRIKGEDQMSKQYNAREKRMKAKKRIKRKKKVTKPGKKSQS